MNESILNTVNQEFINEHLTTDTTKLLLKKHPDIKVSIQELVAQIDAKKRCEKKLPSWFRTANIYYPNKLHIEQTSSEVTANYKAQLLSGNGIIDITGGFGVDAYYFSKRFQHVTHCEINPELSAIAAHNFKQLGVSTIKTVAKDGLEYLKTTSNTYDWLYADPSRRHDSKGKIFFLNDCLPNIPEHIAFLFSKTPNILIKTSPLLDIAIGIKELQQVKSIHVVAVNNEVKELLWVLENNYTGSITVYTSNIGTTDQQTFSFLLEAEATAKAPYSLPLTYVYEPNSAILKAGAFNSVAQQCTLHKLHQHTHLYTSHTLLAFPGRSFKMQTVIPYNKKAFKALGITKANVTTRNFPESVASIRKKLGIADGGAVYLFFTTTMDNQRVVLVCEKV